MNAKDLITVDPDILGGTPGLRALASPTRPFEYIEDNYTLDEFLECFPSVTREMACHVLECSEASLFDPAPA